jgi:hypothetical protein
MSIRRMVKESGDLLPYDGFYRPGGDRNGFINRVESKRFVNICFSPVTALILYESEIRFTYKSGAD